MAGEADPEGEEDTGLCRLNRLWLLFQARWMGYHVTCLSGISLAALLKQVIRAWRSVKRQLYIHIKRQERTLV